MIKPFVKFTERIVTLITLSKKFTKGIATLTKTFIKLTEGIATLTKTFIKLTEEIATLQNNHGYADNASNTEREAQRLPCCPKIITA